MKNIRINQTYNPKQFSLNDKDIIKYESKLRLTPKLNNFIQETTALIIEIWKLGYMKTRILQSRVSKFI